MTDTDRVQVVLTMPREVVRRMRQCVASFDDLSLWLEACDLDLGEQREALVGAEGDAWDIACVVRSADIIWPDAQEAQP